MNRLDAETIILRRVGAYMDLVKIGGNAGSNAHIADALGWAVRLLGHGTDSFTTITDADVEQVAHVDAMLDLAELRTLEIIQGNITLVDLRIGQVDEKLSQLAARLAAMIPDKRATIAAQHNGVLSSPLDGKDKRPAVIKSL